MRFNSQLMYILAEFKHGMVIADQNNPGVRKLPDSVPLIIAPMDAIAEYLARYAPLREAGKSIGQAHNEVLKGGAIILEKGNLLKDDTVIVGGGRH